MKRMTGAVDRREIGARRNQRQRGLHFLDRSKRVARAVHEQRRRLHRSEVAGARLLWLARRMQRIRQQQQRVRDSRLLRRQHGRLPASIGMAAQKHTASGNLP